MSNYKDQDPETPQERQARLHDLSRERPAPERIRRSDELEGMRSDRASSLEYTRKERAQELAVAGALRFERLEVRLTLNEKAIKDNVLAIEKAAKNFKACQDANEILAKKIDEMINSQKLRDAVAITTQELVEKQSKGQVKRRDLVFTVVTLLFALLAVATQITVATGH